MSASSQHLISSFCRTCLQQLRCESSYNLFATPGLAKKLSMCTSLSVELQDGFPDNICGVCYTRLNEIHDFQEQCVNAVQKFQDMVRSIGLNKMKTPSGYEMSQKEQQDKNGIKNENIISNDSEDINTDSENSQKKVIECEQVALGAVEKIEIEETQFIEENFNKKAVKPQCYDTAHSEGKKYECDICEKKYTTFLNLKDHKNIHNGEKPYVCKTCGKEFSHRNYLRSHEITHTEEKHVKCEICDKKFTLAANLRRHKYIHSEGSGGISYKCEICDKKLATAFNLKLHKNIHSGEKTHVCKTCGKQFSHRNSLRQHEVIHTGEKPHKCEICDKKFARAENLRNHKNVHSGEKPHTCKTCGKKYSKLRTLRYHEVTHTGEGLFACKTCGKDFSSRYTLNLHERRHSMKKPFKCEVCLKGFVQSYELKRHRKAHTSESPFICETCGKGFKSAQLLKIHQNKCMHGSCNESEVSDNSKFKKEIKHDSPVSSDMDEQEFISISSK